MSFKLTTAVRVLALDVDGVVLGDGVRLGWARAAEHHLGISEDVLQQRFFRPHWYEAAVGRRSLQDKFAGVIATEGFAFSADDIIRLWLKDDVRHVNTDAIHEALAWQREFDERLVLATNQEAVRAAHIWDGVGLRAHFDRMLVSCELGATKPDAEFFTAADQMLDIERPDEVLLIDDRPNNVEAARYHGWQAVYASGESEAVAAIQELVSQSRS